jgi:hypothetical protein
MPSILDGSLITSRPATDNERDSRRCSEVGHLARCVERIKDNFERIGDGESDEGRLNGLTQAPRCLDRESICAQEVQNFGRGHGSPQRVILAAG